MVNEKPKNDDEALFRHHTKNVQPIKHDKIILRKAPTPVPKKPRSLSYNDPEKNSLQLYDHMSEEAVHSMDRLFFARPGLAPKQIRRFRHGKIPSSATLDLHGFDSETARTSLSQFLMTCYENNKRCITIIHGKGHNTEVPVLKNKINGWLRQVDFVLAFCSAQPWHGGSGAIYVLLKKNLSRFFGN
jgi:DNA-nicking Smr family endonuclease